MKIAKNFVVKSMACAALCAAIAGSAALAQSAAAARQAPASARPAGQAAPNDPRAGLPADYKGPANAVAAIVNDKVITTYDVAQRLRLLLVSGGGQIPTSAIPQLQQRALRELVEEKLKFADGEKWKVDVEAAELDAELAEIAGQSGLSLTQFTQALSSQGVDVGGLRDQIRAQMTWQRIISGRFRSRVKVSDKEIDDQLDRLRNDATKEQFLISEICIPVPDPQDAQQYYEGGLQLIAQMRRGVPFAAVAQRFSACSSAATGGDLGWVRAGELPKELDEAVRALPPGAVTNPIPSEGAFVILALRDKREAASAGEMSYTLAYVGAPLDRGRNEALLAIEKLKSADACATGRALRQDIGSGAGVALLEGVKLREVDPRFRGAIDGLPRGGMSGAIEADGALHAALVCEIDEGLGLPSRASVEDKIMGRQLGRIAAQYLRDIERASMVDIRMKPAQPARQQG